MQLLLFESDIETTLPIPLGGPSISHPINKEEEFRLLAKESNSFALQKDKGLFASVALPIVLSMFGISVRVFCPQANEYKNVSIVNET